MFKKSALFGAAACLAVSTAASAAGLFVGADLGYQQLRENTNPMTVTNGANVVRANLNPLGNGFRGGVFAGYGWCAGEGWYIAPELKFSGASSATSDSVALTGGIANTISFNQKLRYNFNVSVKPGYYVYDNTMLYARVGWSNARITSNVTDTATALNVTDNRNVNGWEVGGGVEVNLTGQLGVRGEFIHTEYSHYTWTSTNAAATTTAATTERPFSNEVNLGLVWTIGNLA